MGYQIALERVQYLIDRAREYVPDGEQEKHQNLVVYHSVAIITGRNEYINWFVDKLVAYGYVPSGDHANNLKYDLLTGNHAQIVRRVHQLPKKGLQAVGV